MKKLTIQQVCCIYPKNEYRREDNTFIKGNVHCISKNQIIKEYDDCWITLSQPQEVIGEIVNMRIDKKSYWKGYYPSNIVELNILYNKIKPTTYFMHHQPIIMEADMYKGNPVIKALFRFCSVIVIEESLS